MEDDRLPARWLQFEVLSATAIRLVSLLSFIKQWTSEGNDLGDVPLAWLRYQLDGGPDSFRSAFATRLFPAWDGCLDTGLNEVQLLWLDVQTAMKTPTAKGNVALDEAQMLAHPFPHHEIPVKVSSLCCSVACSFLSLIGTFAACSVYARRLFPRCLPFAAP